MGYDHSDDSDYERKKKKKSKKQKKEKVKKVHFLMFLFSENNTETKERHVSDDEEMDYDADVKEEPDSGEFFSKNLIKTIIGVKLEIKQSGRIYIYLELYHLLNLQVDRVLFLNAGYHLRIIFLSIALVN